jgi:hypothetical protein
MRTVALASLVLAACAHVPVSARPEALARHADELAARGHARVEVEQGGTTSVGIADSISIHIPGDERTHLWGLFTTGTPDETRRLSLGSFIAGCDASGRGPNCLASRAPDPIQLGTRRSFDPEMFAVGVFGALAVVVGSICLATCRTHGDAAYVGTGLGVVTLLVPLSTVF